LEPAGVALAALAMSVGWGFRGDYGHEAGAMVPGALLALAICLGSGRRDWWQRFTIMAMCGAIGWAFGGQMSYGRVIGYTASSSLPDVAYGYASLFLIGGLWGGIGAAILSLSVTESRSYLERFAGPLIVLGLVWIGMDLTGHTESLAKIAHLNDTDWIAASSALIVGAVYAVAIRRERQPCYLIMWLAVGWWAGYVILTVLLGLHMTPPRSDNWSGCVGLFAALLLYLIRRRNRAAVLAAFCGFLAGGIGFAVGDFVQMLGRAQWGPIGRWEALQGLDYWKWMEQLFGLVMGAGVGLVFLTRMRPKLAPPAEDDNGRNLNTVGLIFLLLIMMWSNLHKNVRTWAKGNHIPEQLFGINTGWWFLLIRMVVSSYRPAALGGSAGGDHSPSPATVAAGALQRIRTGSAIVPHHPVGHNRGRFHSSPARDGPQRGILRPHNLLAHRRDLFSDCRSSIRQNAPDRFGTGSVRSLVETQQAVLGFFTAGSGIDHFVGMDYRLDTRRTLARKPPSFCTD
jgi:hypothetical protein